VRDAGLSQAGALGLSQVVAALNAGRVANGAGRGISRQPVRSIAHRR
jgi:hypothetical protein